MENPYPFFNQYGNQTEIPTDFYRIDVGLNEWFVIPQRYAFKKYLGRGTQGFVAQFHDNLTQCDVTIKKVPLPEDITDRIPFKRAIRELHCMIHLNHPNIVKLYDVFTPYRTADKMREFYIVREYLLGTMRSIRLAKIDHDHVQKIIHDVCRGVKHLHQTGIAHSNLKPENVLCSRNTDVKLCDFGQSNTEPSEQNPYNVMRHYRAPEVLCHVYTNRNSNADVWSIGCMLGELLFDQALFNSVDHIDQYKKIVERFGSPRQSFIDRMPLNVQHFVQSIPYYSEKSADEKFASFVFARRYRAEPAKCLEAHDLLNRMLIIDPNERLTIDQVLQHPYLRNPSQEYGPIDVAHDARAPDFYTWQEYFDDHAHREEIFKMINDYHEAPPPIIDPTTSN